MPAIPPSTNNNELAEFINSGKTYSYEYPNGMNLKPGSKMHDKIRTMVMDRARESFDYMKCRHESWNKIDRTLTAYVPLKDEEARIKADDERKPVSIVVPLSYAALDTLMAYWMSALLEDPIFR